MLTQYIVIGATIPPPEESHARTIAFVFRRMRKALKAQLGLF